MYKSLRNILLILFSTIISVANASGPHTSAKNLLSSNSVFAGDVVEYQIQFACNSLTGDCGNLTINDNLPAELEILSCSPPLGFTVTCPVGGNDIVVTKDTAFDGGDTFQLSIQSRVRLGTPGGTVITNTATTTITDGPGGIPEVNNPSAPPVTVQPGVADYVTRKTLTDPSAPIGPALDAEVIYSVQMCATSAVGNENMTNVVLTDTFPVGAIVINSDGGAIASNTITWNIPDAEIALATLYASASLTSEQCISRTVALIFPTGTFNLGDAVNNTVTATGTPAGGPGTGFGPGNDTDTTIHVIVVSDIQPSTSKVADDVVSGPGEGPMVWAINANTDTANVAVPNFTVYEPIPNNGNPNTNPVNIFPLSITSGRWNSPVNANGATDVRATIEYSTDVVATPGLCTTASYGTLLDTNIASPASSNTYALPNNASCVRWVFTDVSVNTDAPAVPRHWRFTTSPLLTLDTQTVPGAYPQVVENCLVTTFTLNGVPTTDGPDCFTANIEDPTVAIASQKIRLAPTGNALPGQEIQERLTFTHIDGDSTIGVVDPIIADLLPPQLEFVSWDAYNVAGGLNPPNLEVITNYAGTGRTMVRFSWSVVPVGVQINGAAGIANSETFAASIADADMPQMDITLKIKDGTPAGTYTNELAFFDTNPSDRLTCGASANESGIDLSGNNDDGLGTDSDDLFCRGTDSIGVLSSAVLGGSKWVRGDGSTGDGVNTSSDDPTIAPSIINAACPDVPAASGFTRFPCAAWTDVGGSFEYELRLVNAGNIGLEEYTLYDVLPNIGDKGVGPALSFTDRDSRWRPELAGAVTLVAGTLIDGITPFNPAGAVIEYSTAANPCRDDLADPNNPTVCDAEYGPLPGVLDTVTAYRIKIPFGTAWPPGATFTLNVPMLAPINAPPSIDADAANFNPAWNSFAHVARQEGAANFLLPAEPRKVGIVVPSSFRLGNLVWIDSNRNGTADVGEPGIEGVNVLLYIDTDSSNGPSAADAFVDAMLTDVDGHYMFENLGPNNYYVLIPDGQNGGGQPLENLFETDVGEEIIVNFNGDNNDNGTVTAVLPVAGLASSIVTLGPLFDEPTGEETRDGSGSDEIDFYPDALSNLTVDIGYWRPFSLGNQVWLDNGPGADFNNGFFDASESGIDGMTVNLLRSNNSPFLDPVGGVAVTTTTANGGFYLFENIPAGNYKVALDLTSGVGFTHLSTSTGANANTGPFESPPDADGNATDEDDNGRRINNSTIRSRPVTIGAANAPAEPIMEAGAVDAMLVNGQGTAPDGTALPDIQANITLDFGLFESYSVGNRVWFDDDDSGDINGAEAGINNVTVNLYDAADLNTILDTMTTNANGYYRFDFLRAGDYIIETQTPAGTHSSTPNAGDPDADLDEDDDNGVDLVTHVGFVLSDAITVGPGASEQTTDVKDGPGDATLAAVDDHNDMSVDFGFVKEFSLGNRVWLDANNNGVIDATENGINGVTVNLYEDFDTNGTPDGVAIATMLTAANGGNNGYYRFDGLLSGTYMVEVDAANFGGALTDLISSTPNAGDPDADVDDSDDNGSDLTTTAGAVFSAPITLGQADNEPLNEADLGVGGQGSTLDSRANMTVDFGFFEPLSLGNLVWIDTDNDGSLNGAEIGHPLVAVQVYRDTDANGVFNPANDTLIDTDMTDPNGFYLFTNLGADDYFVHIPVANFAPAGVLAGYSTSTGADALVGPSEPAASPEDSADTVDDGSFSLVSLGTVSLPVTLAPNSEPLLELPTATTIAGDDGAGTPDNDSNLTVDFGFYQAVSIGSTVFEDTDNSGHQDGGEAPIANVDVELWGPGLDGVIGGGDDVMIDTTMTNGTGDYIFANLPVGDYYVVVSEINFNAGNALENLASSSYPTVTVDAITDDGDDHGAQSGGSGTVTTSPLINLSLGAEPIDGVDETEQGNLQDNNIIDANGDMTVDFGFFNPVNPMSLGSTVFLDPNNNGMHEGGEAGIPAVDLELWSTGADGVIGGTDDVQVGSTTTDGAGDYIFTDLDEGDYYVLIPTPPVANPFSSTPTATTDNDLDGNDDGAQVGGIGTSVISPLVNLTAGAEVDNTVETEIGIGGAQDNALIETNGNMTVDFGFTNPANLVTIGSTVFEDPDNSGTQTAGESGIVGIAVELWLPGGDGVIGGGDDSLFATDVTGATGDYFFENLAARDYYVVIPDSNFAVAAALEFLPLSSSPTSVTDDQTDGDDNGEQAAGSGTRTISPLISLAVGTEPLAAAENALTGGNQDDVYEDNGDMTIDFGFFLPANPVSLGSTLFIDVDNNGIHDVGDNGIPAIDVELWAPGTDGVIGGGDDVQVGSDTTDANGDYFFENLAEGDYFVIIPTPPVTHPRSSTPTSNADNIDGNDDGIQLAGIGTPVNSDIVNLQSGMEVDNTVETELGLGGAQDDTADTSGNMTVDFGFITPDGLVSIGSTVYQDTNNSGTQDGGENGIPAVNVELWMPGADNMIGGGDDTLFSTESTDGNGDFIFFKLPAGNYYLRIPSSNFIGAGALTTLPLSSVPTSLFDDQDDIFENGVQVAGIGTETLSPVINLAVGLEPLNANEPSSGGNQDDTSGDANGDMTIDFGFLAPVNPVSIGSTVFLDPDNSGTHDVGEAGVPAVDLELWSPGIDGVKGGVDDLQIDVTTTDGNGDYIFDNLPDGVYYIVIPTPPVTAPLSSTPTTGGDDQTDGDDNGDQVNTGDMVMSVLIDLMAGAEPDDAAENEIGIGGDQDNGTDINGDMTIDFGFTDPAVLVSLGSTIFVDLDNSGTQAVTEAGVAGVTVEFWSPGLDGVIGGGDDVMQDSMITNATGDYFFNNYPPGDYFVVIPGSNFNVGQPLENIPFSSVPTILLDNQIDSDDHGLQPLGAGTMVTSPLITLAVGAEPLNPGEIGITGGNQDDTFDANGDMTIDFGFLAVGTPVSIGSTVFIDLDNDGLHDIGESGIPAIDLELWWPGTDGVKGGGDDVQIDFTTTDGNGDYIFDGLPPGDYYIVIPTPPVGTPLSSTPPTGGDDQTDGDDNGDQVNSGDMVMSVIINLSPGTEPDDATEDEVGIGGDQDNAADTDGDMTIDFGFVDPATLLSIGSTVFHDPNDSGFHDPTENSIPGVAVELWSPGADGVILGGDDALLSTTVTDANGDYFFGLLPTGLYYVAIPDSNFEASGVLLLLSKSSTPTSISDDGVDGDDNGDQPGNPGTIVYSPIISLTVDGEPVNATETEQGNLQDDADDDNGDMTIDFGFKSPIPEIIPTLSNISLVLMSLMILMFIAFNRRRYQL